MPRKITPKETERDLQAAYDAVLKAVRVTNPHERESVAVAWCQNKDRLGEWDTLCERRGILPIDLLIVALMQVDHPLLTRPNGDFAFNNFVHARVRILQAILHNEAVPIPLCTTPVQLAVVHTQG